MLIDFNEIPQSNNFNGKQDVFELFARDFLKSIGYEIIDDPGRGADGGIDIKIKERRKGINEQFTDIYWLVSCKHYSHSGNSITLQNEQDIMDRVLSNNCQGFMGFYSTIPSEGLKNKLKGLSDKIDYYIYDSEKIESQLIRENDKSLLKRYFPKSFKKTIPNPIPIDLFNYYYDKENFDGKNIFDEIFITREELLNSLINSENLTEFINYAYVELIEDDLNEKFYQILTEIGKKYNKYNSKERHRFEIELMIEYLENKYKINLKKSLKFYGFGFLDCEIRFYLFNNYLFVNKCEKEHLDGSYKKLKTIIT